MVLDVKNGEGQECAHFCQRGHSGLDGAEGTQRYLWMECVSHQRVDSGWNQRERKEGHYHQTIHTHFASGGQSITIPQCN